MRNERNLSLLKNGVSMVKNKKRYEIQFFDYADGSRSWHVYDCVERYHIHTATQEFLKDDNSVPECCKKICNALNVMETK